MPDARLEEPRPCPDEECGGTAEPEDDEDLHYWVCTECGFAFGFYQEQPDAACQLGVPEAVRRHAVPPAPAPAGGPVFLGTIGRRPSE